MGKERILLAHGWLAGPSQLDRLARAIAGAGYDVGYVAHRSLFGRFDTAVAQALRLAEADTSVPVHLVGFSLGGLVMRAAAAAMAKTPASLLLIGAPNAGSTLADLVARVFSTPAVRRISSHAPPLPEPPAGVPVGCIVGDRRGIVGRLLAGRNDSRVTVASALAIRHDEAHIVHCKHRSLHRDKETLRITIAFLKKHDAVPGCPQTDQTKGR